MSGQTVVAFPGRDYLGWLSWVECELSILGFEMSNHAYDWQAAFDSGLRPEIAAEQAAEQFANP